MFNIQNALSREDLPGHVAPVLTTRLLSRVHQLNGDYIELLIAECALPQRASQLQYLPARLHTALAALAPAARALLAALPFTLYSLGFEDENFWLAACGAKAASRVEQRYAPADSSSPQGSFREVALLHAWHVASSSRLASRVVYAMSDSVSREVAAAALWRIRRIAADYPVLLMPRWPTNPAFWPDLLQYAAAGDVDRLSTVKLLGSQLIAAELTSTIARGSPRLRARKLVARWNR